MADRLSKLSEYLNSQNYELAIQIHKNSNQSIQLEEPLQLKLAKAYFYLLNDYLMAIQILQKIKESRYLQIYYEARMLLIKALFLSNSPQSDIAKCFQQLQRTINNSTLKDPNRISYLNKCIKQVAEVMKSSIRQSQQKSSEDQRRQFEKYMREEDDNALIMEGMPKFIISVKWFQAWKQYTSVQKIQRQKRHPGPITQFQILDHPFRVFYDSNPSKGYTNVYLFNGCGYEILPKKCWQLLCNNYGGIEIKRFNISFIDKPYQIMTEVYLKKIQIAKQQKGKQALNFCNVQITKKQAWSGLKNKLAQQWGYGQIMEYNDKKTNTPVIEGQVLEEVDTIGKRYIYVSVPGKKEANGHKIQKCGNKECQKTQKLIFCKCKSIKYCNMDCLKADFKNHKKKCELQEAHQKQQSAIFKNFNLQEKDFAGMKGRVGLKNLGNTCYMNSGLQCLSNTKEMTEYFMKDQFKNHINNSNPLGTKGNLACTYAQLIRQIWTGSSESVSPFKLKKIIGNFATQFSGFGQQDSQQFISQLIDGLSQDLNLVKKKESFETGDQIKPDQQMSRESQMNYSKRIQSYVRNLMVGQFKSTVVCLTCKKVSVCFDPYLLISLPIPSNDEWEIYFVPSQLSRGAIKFPFQYTRFTTLEKITNDLVTKLNKRIEQDRQKRQPVSPDRLLYLLLDGDKFEILKIFKGNEKIATIKGKYLLFCLQIPATTQDLFIGQFIYKDQRISFPRFLKIGKKSNSNTKQQVICEAIERGNLSQKTKLTYSEAVAGQKIVDSKPYKIIEITCRKKYKLLTYVDCSKEGISRFTQSNEQSILTLDDCLNSFAQEENLVGDNQWYCNKCKQHKQATRNLQIFKSNKILVIAFKRFNRLRKIRAPVKFPIQNFNMGPYLLSNKSKAPILYDLYGVVNHYGNMGGGHYTAYCQNFLNKKWYEFNDSRVSEISKSDVVSTDSYVLFFRRKD